MESETIELLLANRSFLYALVARAFVEEIDENYVRILASEHAREEMRLVDSDVTERIVEVFDSLVKELSKPGMVDVARREYVRILVGPGTLRANPWETVQLSGKRSLFQPGVLEVRDAYRAAGFLPVRVREVPDDFIGVELDFLAKLAEKAFDEFEADDPSWRNTLAQSRAFLDKHLLKWVGLFADAVAAEYGDVLYARFSRLSALIADRDRELLESML